MSLDGLLSFRVCGSWASVHSKRVYPNSHSMSGYTQRDQSVAVWDAKKTQDNLVLYLQHFDSAQPLKPQSASQTCSVSNTGQFLVEASVSDFGLLPPPLTFVCFDSFSFLGVSHLHVNTPLASQHHFVADFVIVNLFIYLTNMYLASTLGLGVQSFSRQKPDDSLVRATDKKHTTPPPKKGQSTGNTRRIQEKGAEKGPQDDACHTPPRHHTLSNCPTLCEVWSNATHTL